MRFHDSYLLCQQPGHQKDLIKGHIFVNVLGAASLTGILPQLHTDNAGMLLGKYNNSENYG